MNYLSDGERLVRCLAGQPVDRMPFGVGIGWCPWGETMERWRKESGNEKLDLAAEFDFDAGFALPNVEYGFFPAFAHVTIKESAEYVTWRDARGITMRNRRDGGSMPEFLEHPVKNPDDWFRLKKERLQIGDAGRIQQDWDAFRARLKKTGEAVQVGTFPWGVFGTARDLLGVETLLVNFYDEPEMMHDMMRHMTMLWISVWEQVAREVPIDHIHIWEDMSGKQGSLISPAMVEEFMMPCYDRVADFAKTHGVRIMSVDTDGDCQELVPIMMKHGVNMFLPFEVQAGNDIRQYRAKYPTLGIMGGLDKKALALGHREIDEEVARAAEMGKHGRYVPGFDHLIPPDVGWENFQYAATRLRQACGVT
jgi:uroporphyrinogen decarboxylase